MALEVTSNIETKNNNKGAEIKAADGTIIGTIAWDTTNQEYTGISFHLNISRKDLFVENKELYESDILNFLNEFISKTVEINTTSKEPNAE